MSGHLITASSMTLVPSLKRSVSRDLCLTFGKIEFRLLLAIDSLTESEKSTGVIPLGHRVGLCEDLVGTHAQKLSQLYQLQGKVGDPFFNTISFSPGFCLVFGSKRCHRDSISFWISFDD